MTYAEPAPPACRILGVMLSRKLLICNELAYFARGLRHIVARLRAS
jgi:hypothetical protein